MSDNVDLTTLTGKAAADEFTYSGELAHAQITREVYISGPEGSKTLTEIAGPVGTPGSAGYTVQGHGSSTPLKIRPSSAGTGGHYDSGLVTLPASPTDLQTATVYVDFMYFVNITDVERTVTVKNKAGTPVAYLDAFILPGRQFVSIPMGGIAFSNGITWSASATTSVNGQIRGNL